MDIAGRLSIAIVERYKQSTCCYACMHTKYYYACMHAHKAKSLKLQYANHMACIHVQIHAHKIIIISASNGIV